MSWFKRPVKATPRILSDIGTFVFDKDSWLTPPDEDSLVLVVTGSDFDIGIIDVARTLIPRLEDLSQNAIDYVRKNGTSLWEGTGDLKLEAVDLTDLLNHDFALTLGLSTNPDFTITVEFHDNQPVQIWTAD